MEYQEPVIYIYTDEDIDNLQVKASSCSVGTCSAGICSTGICGTTTFKP